MQFQCSNSRFFISFAHGPFYNLKNANAFSLLCRIHLPSVVLPVDMEKGRQQHDISGIISLKLALCKNFGFSAIVEDQKKDCNIIFYANTRHYFGNALPHQK